MSTSVRNALGAVGLGLLAALFFTCTYVFNRAAATHGGDWAWTAALRYFITLPLLLPLVGRAGAARTWRALCAAPGPWLLWSGIGFVLFYLLLSFAADSGPSWLVAGTFQLTVVAGPLCAPLLYRDGRARVPTSVLATGALILVGVALMQVGASDGALDRHGWIAFVCVALSAFAYPLGNRGLLLHLERRGLDLGAAERVFGMTLASQPAWLAVAVWAGSRSGPPPVHQIGYAAGVALGAGVIATVVFFRATGRVRHEPTALAAVEAMQAAELLFAGVIGALWLHEPWMHGSELVGAALVTLGIVLFSRAAARAARDPDLHAIG